MSNFTFSSLLSKYLPPGGSASPTSADSKPNSARSTPSLRTDAPQRNAASVPTTTVRTGTPIARPQSSIPRGDSRPRPASNAPASANAPANAPARKPKSQAPTTKEQEEMMERKKKLMDALKRKKEKESREAAAAAEAARAARASAAAVSSTARPNGRAAAPPAMSYQMMLAQAKEKHNSTKSVGTITHKARETITEKKEWQKKLANKNGGAKDGPERKSKSPAAAVRPESKSAGGKKINDPGKNAPLKKTGTTTDGKRPPIQRAAIPPSRWEKKHAEMQGKRKREDTGARRYGAPKRSRYDDEDDEDDWIVDDEDEAPRATAASKRYRYAESDYDSESDMEATGADVLEEEERARRIAIKEDLEQERLEQEAAERKRKLLKK